MLRQALMSLCSPSTQEVMHEHKDFKFNLTCVVSCETLSKR